MISQIPESVSQSVRADDDSVTFRDPDLGPFRGKEEKKKQQKVAYPQTDTILFGSKTHSPAPTNKVQSYNADCLMYEAICLPDSLKHILLQRDLFNNTYFKQFILYLLCQRLGAGGCVRFALKIRFGLRGFCHPLRKKGLEPTD